MARSFKTRRFEALGTQRLIQASPSPSPGVRIYQLDICT